MKDNFILKDKKILFFSQYFFGYERIIKEKLEELKAKVVMYNEMSVKTTFDLLTIDVISFGDNLEK